MTIQNIIDPTDSQLFFERDINLTFAVAIAMAYKNGCDTTLPVVDNIDYSDLRLKIEVGLVAPEFSIWMGSEKLAHFAVASVYDNAIPALDQISAVYSNQVAELGSITSESIAKIPHSAPTACFFLMPNVANNRSLAERSREVIKHTGIGILHESTTPDFSSN